MKIKSTETDNIFIQTVTDTSVSGGKMISMVKEQYISMTVKYSQVLCQCIYIGNFENNLK